MLMETLRKLEKQLYREQRSFSRKYENLRKGEKQNVYYSEYLL